MINSLIIHIFALLTEKVFEIRPQGNYRAEKSNLKIKSDKFIRKPYDNIISILKFRN